MHNELIRVEDNPNLRRDAKTNAIVDVDSDAYKNYIRNKQLRQEQQLKNTLFEERINNLESDISDIKRLLTQLVERQ